MRRITANGRRPAWGLNLDVASFFSSIDKDTLYAIIGRAVRDPELLWLTRTILFHDPTADYHFKRGAKRTPLPDSGQYPVPARKSLFGNDNRRGLPIGNLTSQFWANVYLNELDQFVKRELKCRRYVRYVDDLVLLDEKPDTLLDWRVSVAAFLGERLKLCLREADAEPKAVSRGIDFVGWKTFWNHRVPRGRTFASCEARLRSFRRRELQPLWGAAAYRLDFVHRPGALPQLRSTLASYSGHLRHGGACRRWAALWRRHGWLYALFVIEPREPWRVRARWPERALGGPHFAGQYRRLVRHAGDGTLVFCQVGKFVEFYGPQRMVATEVLGLRRVSISRAGFAFSAGFPRSSQHAYVSRAVRAGYAVADVREIGRVSPRCAERRVVAVVLPRGTVG